MKDLTVIVATYERHAYLDRMISSFRNYYPDLSFVVVDSSKLSYSRDDITYIKVPEGSGISFQRNTALAAVKTKYFLLVDDDYICNEKTHIVSLYEPVKNGTYDIIWWEMDEIDGDNFDFHWKYEIYNNELFHFVWISNDSNWIKCDTIVNFFVSETSRILKIWWWDNNLKFALEHDDFFLNAKKHNLTIWYLGNIRVIHDHLIKHHWWPKSANCIEYFCKKRGVDNKIEIRKIEKNKQICIHYTSVLKPQRGIDNYIISKIYDYYGKFPIKLEA